MVTAHEEMLAVMPVKTGGFFAHAWNGWSSVSFAFVADEAQAEREAQAFVELKAQANGYSALETTRLHHPLWGDVVKVETGRDFYGWRVATLYIVINRNLAGQDRIVTWDND